MIRVINRPDVGPPLLPSKIYAQAGAPITIYHRNICVARDASALTWAYALGADAGALTTESWTVTPTVNATLSVRVSCPSQTAVSASCPVVIVTAPPATGKKVLLVGDSLTADGRYPDRVAAVLSNCTFLGLQTSAYGGTKHEGHSGFSFYRYCTDADSPFVAAGVLNVPAYLATLGDVPDVVLFELGINDMINYTMSNYAAGLTAWKTYADQLLAAWAIAAPSASFYLASVPSPNYREAAFWNDYGSVGGTITAWRWQQVRRELLLSQFSNFATTLVPAHMRIDNASGFAVTSGVHPNASGYTQLGNEIADGLLGRIAGL